MAHAAWDTNFVHNRCADTTGYAGTQFSFKVVFREAMVSAEGVVNAVRVQF